MYVILFGTNNNYLIIGKFQFNSALVLKINAVNQQLYEWELKEEANRRIVVHRFYETKNIKKDFEAYRSQVNPVDAMRRLEMDARIKTNTR